MKHILVTGGSGFVGRHLLSGLAAAFPDARLSAAEFDLRDHGAVQDRLRADPPDFCIHLAAVAAVQAAQTDPDTAWQVNLHGTLGLARALLAEAPRCTLVFASTADAYGQSFRGGAPATEATALAPMNIYAASKAAADLALGAIVNTDLRVIRVRAFNHTGPGQSSAFVVASFARQLARIAIGLQPPLLRVGALEPRRDFLDVRDVCRAYCLCLERAEQIPPGTVINIASGTSRRIGDILTGLIRLAGVETEIETETARLRSSDIPTATGDASLARAILGWAPEIPWETTLVDILRDWRERVLLEA